MTTHDRTSSLGLGSDNRVPWVPSARYPDPAVQVLDQSFARYRLNLASVERLAHGLRWCEGPVWFGDGRYLLWSDIPNDRILKWEEETAAVSVFRQPSNLANGNTRDRQGRLVTCEHGARRLTRTEYDGTLTVIVDRFDGKPLNSPNDVVVKSDGSIWFTDPPFGLLSHYEGRPGKQELPTNVYRVDGQSAEVTVVEDSINRPNGLCFSPDESALYIVESGTTPRNVYAYDVVDRGRRLSGKRKLIDAGPGTPDGMRCDVDGNLWIGWGMGDAALDGVNVYNPEGRLIGRIALPERCANVCFGGLHRHRLFMAAARSVYALYVNTQGVAGA
jgi:gluconolactonase